jgi:hypothetical protein
VTASDEDEVDVGRVTGELDALSNVLHDQVGGSTGGPLHVVIDDGNIRDSDVVSCLAAVECEGDMVVRVLCREIFSLLCLLTEPQRLVWWLRGDLVRLGIDYVALARRVRDGTVDRGVDGTHVSYTARIMQGEETLWEGLRQVESQYGKHG